MRKRFFVTVFMLLAFFYHIPQELTAQVPVQDSLALVALYDSTNGASWTNNTNWLSDNISTWYGITVLNNRITGIALASNNLAGTIPVEIGNLSMLESLDLGWNFLIGTMPSEIGNLANLTYLHLGANSLDGPIPPEIGNLSSLTNLTLYANSFSGSIPPEIGNLVNLTFLAFRNNSMSGSIPPEIGNLTNLTGLWLDDNHFNGVIPSEIGNLANLNTLFLDYNSLSGSIPPEIGNLAMLRKLQLHNNLLTGSIPNEIGNLSNLFYLKLSYNSLNGAIPDTLRNLSSLIYLYLAGNQFSGSIPDFLGNLTILDHIDLSDNLFTGTIPGSLGNLPNLITLYLGNNQLSGTIPAEFGNLSNLSSLFLHDNQLSGAVPDSIVNCANLSDLGIENNQLEDLPDLGSLTNLAWLVVQNNRFTFEDIEPNINVATSSFIYAPQDSIGEGMDTTIVVGDYLALSVTVGGSANQYQWMKDGIDIPGAVDSIYLISMANAADSGSYICKINNSIATELTLYSRPVNVTVEDPSSISDSSSTTPEDYNLYQNYPNPYNPATTIKYQIPELSFISLKVFDLLGNEISILVNEEKPAGNYEVEFPSVETHLPAGRQGRDASLPSGVYFYQLKAGEFVETKKMILLK